MLGFGGKRDSAATAAPVAATPPTPHKRDATEGFPRGLPDGERDKPVASGRWPSSAEIATLLPEWQPGMFLLGRDETGRYFGHQDDRHVLTVAGSRAGKGVSLIVPNLLFWPGSAIVIDPKGELATLTASRRSAEGSPTWSVPMTPGEGEVYALDPFGRVTGAARQHAFAGFNPMAEIDLENEGSYDLCYQLADALIVQADGDGAHWTQSGRAVLTTLIFFTALVKPPAERNLITVRRLVTGGEAALTRLFTEMQEHRNEYVSRAGAALLGTGSRELSTIISGIATQTAFLESPEMERVLTTSSFRLEDLKTKRITIYLCLPSMRLATHGAWLRLFVSMAMDAMERTGPLLKGQHPVLFCLDEFAALGTMATVEKASGQIASFGVKLWPIIQDLTQLKRDYREGWETFMGNAGLLTFFGNTDLTTTDHIAARLGEAEVVRLAESASRSWQVGDGETQGNPMLDLFGGKAAAGNASKNRTGGGNTALNETIQRVPLMQGSEIVRAFSRESGKLLVMIPDKPPIALYRCVHHSVEDDGLCGGLFDEIPGQEKPRTTRAGREERDRARRRGR